MASIVAFHETSGAPHSLEQVGGKALSLVTMTQAGMPVPPGFVLTVQFFEPWLAALPETSQWSALLRADAEQLAGLSKAVQVACASLTFTDDQRTELAAALDALREANGETLFAVRSSSPDEDLDVASFAGGYETTLGVTRDNLEVAIRASFASAFDARVFLYKRERNIATRSATYRGDRPAARPCDERGGCLLAQSAEQLLR